MWRAVFEEDLMPRFGSLTVFNAFATFVLVVATTSCNSPANPPAEQTTPATERAAPPSGDDAAAIAGEAAKRAFIRMYLDKAVWNVTEGNTLGVRTTVVEGDPSKPGFYLTINRFPPGVMSRPHFHPDERYCLVLKGTWYTSTSDKFTPEETEGLKPGDYMRHPAGATHYDGALDEEVLVAISGYGPTSATVIDKGELFGRSRPAK